MLHLPTNQSFPEEPPAQDQGCRRDPEHDRPGASARRGTVVPLAGKRTAGSFGHYLQMARIERRMGLEEISRRTRIGMDVLRAIENEELDALPAEVFVKGFLRAYAREVRVDGDLAVQRYMAAVHAEAEKRRFNRRMLRRGNRLWNRLVAALFLLAALIAGTIMLVSDRLGSRPAETAPAAAVVTAAPRGVAPASAKRLPPPHANRQETPASAVSPEAAGGATAAKGRYLLKVVAIGDTWLKVIADDRAPRRYRLHPGDRLELRASSGFNLLVGDAAGVRMEFNGRPVNLYGKSGQTVTLQLP